MSATADAATPILRRSLQENGVILTVMTSYVLATGVLAAVYGFPFRLSLYSPLWALMAALGLAYFAGRRWTPAAWRVDERLAMAGPLLLLTPAFFSAFTSVKSAIAQIHPYAWDARLAQADRLLLGEDGWRLLQPALGHAPVTFALSMLYSAWHLVLMVVFSLLALTLERPRLRQQGLIALMLCWALLGTWAAIAFSSVGPCFSGLVGGAAPAMFTQQAAYLQSVSAGLPLFEFTEQHRLLTAAQSGQPMLGSGISAMPSMHVAVALLVALIGWKTARWAGALATAYLAAVAVASVHLGWHYAWDVIAALVGAAAIWGVSGELARPARR